MRHPEIIIGERKVGYLFPPLVISEIGINHGGNLDVALKMVDAAHEAGAEIIKHQTHVIDDEMSSSAKEVIPGNADISIYEIMSKCALNENDEYALKDHVEGKGMLFISTPFSRAAANRLQKMDIPAYKIGSGECNNYPLIEHIAEFGKPIILSTGMNSISSIEKAVSILRKHKTPYALLHCTNVYPTPYHLVRLGAVEELRDHFPDAVIGLSDHTTDNFSCLGSIAVGASIVERHFTDSKERVGPDIICSMTPKELKELIIGSNAIKEARGGKKGAIKEEKATIDFAFASVVSIKDIKKGEEFTRDNIWVKRPGTGYFSAENYNSLLGLNAACDINTDSHINPDQVMGLTQ